MAITKLNFGAYPAGTVLQTVHTSTGALDTTTTTVPYDDTIMQITEGKEFMTLNITPKFSASKLLIKAQIHISPSTDSLPTMGLFVGTTANALATTFLHTAGGANFPKVMTLEHFMTAGSTSALTFRIRAGQNNTGTTTFNGRSGARFHGGTLASTMTIMEIAQ